MQNPTEAYYITRPRRERDALPRTPAGRIVRQLGGVGPTARFAERAPKTVYAWLATKAEGGTGGRVPHQAQERIIANAAKRGLVLDHADFSPKAGEAFT